MDYMDPVDRFDTMVAIVAYQDAYLKNGHPIIETIILVHLRETKIF